MHCEASESNSRKSTCSAFINLPCYRGDREKIISDDNFYHGLHCQSTFLLSNKDRAQRVSVVPRLKQSATTEACLGVACSEPNLEHTGNFGSVGHILYLGWGVDYINLYVSPNSTNCILKFAFHYI